MSIFDSIVKRMSIASGASSPDSKKEVVSVGRGRKKKKKKIMMGVN
jgi:hypothetical protein